MALLDLLRARLGPPGEDNPARRASRRAWREVSGRLLAPVLNHRVALDGAPVVGFLAELYPEARDFALPLAEVQDLNRAWNRYKRGTQIAALGYRIHPFYGVYAPSRAEHLELFATWLSGYRGPRQVAVDVGTGSGVLALLIAKAGFAEVLATDLNPNAVEGVRRQLARATEPPPVSVRQADLLGGAGPLADLIAFNPPWTEGPIDTPLDAALYYPPDLFPRFFDQALARLSPEGRVVLVFSDVIRLVQPDSPHPIDAELARGRLRLVQRLRRKVHPPKGSRTRERVEVWELARA
ncbi:MAG: methyltransferase [Deltaproteobacteria bacterium]|nr:methyltransferase [Deltaproteobacteria bacterium]